MTRILIHYAFGWLVCCGVAIGRDGDKASTWPLIGCCIAFLILWPLVLPLAIGAALGRSGLLP